MNKRREGSRGEDLAVDFLKKKGYRILDRNYRFGRGELDIVAEDNRMLVFVEVKSRRTELYGDPIDALTPSKCTQLRKIAEGYLFRHHIDDRSCRFDVIAIDYDGEIPNIRHVEDAF